MSQKFNQGENSMLLSKAIFRSTAKIRVFSLAISLLPVGGGGGGSGSAAQYSVTGSVTGLGGDGLVLQNNQTDDLAVAGNNFDFPLMLTFSPTLPG
jgi:hypothetical protein